MHTNYSCRAAPLGLRPHDLQLHGPGRVRPGMIGLTLAVFGFRLEAVGLKSAPQWLANAVASLQCTKFLTQNWNLSLFLAIATKPWLCAVGISRSLTNCVLIYNLQVTREA